MPTSPPADVQSPGAADALFSSPPQFRHSGTLGLGRLRGCADPGDASQRGERIRLKNTRGKKLVLSHVSHLNLVQ